jgi:hypothetical protein
MTRLIVRSEEPVNAEPPAEALVESGYVTSEELVCLDLEAMIILPSCAY